MISKIRFHSDFFWLIVISMLILPVRCLSYNQPRLFNCWNSTNSSVSVTFANSTIVGTSPRGIFIDDTNTFYFAHYANSRLLIWSQVNNSNAPTMTLSVSMSVYTALFVTSKREIYFGASSPPRAIKKITPYSATSTLVHQFSSWCLGLFIDLNETIYCSMYSSDLVRSISLNSSSSGETTRAGNGTKGSASTQLNGTWGIFVDTNYDLYVADAYNNRIQRFLPKETNGTTVAGRGIPNSLLLNFPTDVILDGNGALYIADNMNHRLIRVKSGNYICLTGCTSTPGSGPNQLYKPISLRFDSHGNLYVADEFNNRTQKLIPVPNCGSINRDQNWTHFFLFLETTIVDQSTIVSSLDTSSMLSSSSASIGTLNNISNQPCDILQPCLNDGTCFNNNDTGRGYNCSCSTGFNGDMCQINGRLCQLNMCRNNGALFIF